MKELIGISSDNGILLPNSILIIGHYDDCESLKECIKKSDTESNIKNIRINKPGQYDLVIKIGSHHVDDVHSDREITLNERACYERPDSYYELRKTDIDVLYELEKRFLSDTELFKERERLRSQQPA